MTSVFLQACRAYEQFMIDLVKLIRADRGLSIDETLIREEVKRIIELEAEIANVSTYDIFLAQKHPLFLSLCVLSEPRTGRLFVQTTYQRACGSRWEQLLCKTTTSPL